MPTHYYAQPVKPLLLSQRIEIADRSATKSDASIHHGANPAFCASARDAIQLPSFETFKDKEGYYATTLHELTRSGRSTSAALNANSTRNALAIAAIPREELVPEFGAATHLGITPETRDDQAVYLAHWLNVLKEGKRAILSAATLLAPDSILPVRSRKTLEQRENLPGVFPIPVQELSPHNVTWRPWATARSRG